MQRLSASVLLAISETEGIEQPRTENDWYWYSDGDEGGAIPFNINMLYRGQNQRFVPMQPSLTRGLRTRTDKLCDMPADDQALVILRVAQSWWFARELDYHPVTNHAKEQKVKLNRIALAQHYGIPTGYLDLSDSFDIAAFFATCRWTEEGWRPVENGSGVVYRVALKDMENPFEWLQPLGPQALPRPSEQKAWVAETPLNYSFDGLPIVHTIEFEHDRSIGEYFLNMFNGGEDLFPPDPLDVVAREICGCHQIPLELVENVLKHSSDHDEFGPRPEQFAEILKEVASISEFTEYRRLLDSSILEPFQSDFEWRKKRLSAIKARVRLVHD